MKRILSVIHTPVFGGPHNQMLRLADPLFRRGWDTLVVLPDEPSTGAERLRNAGVHILQIPLHRLRAKASPKVHFNFICRFPSEVGHLRQIIREQQIDLVQICGLMNPHAAIAARFERVPVVWQLLGTTAPMPLRRLLMPVVKSLADVIMTTGLRTAKLHPGALSAGERLIIFSPPVDTQRFISDGQRRMMAREKLNVPEDAILIGTVGNFNKLKGHEFLIDAFVHIQKMHPQTRVRILGDVTTHSQYYTKEVLGRARALGLLENGQIGFMNPHEHVADFLPAFDIFALTSRAEGVPTVVLEAMSCSLPVVATDVGSVCEVVENQVTGYIVPPLNSEAIADAILKLISDSETRAQMGAISRQRAVEKYDTNVCADTHVEAYEMAIAHHMNRVGK